MNDFTLGETVYFFGCYDNCSKTKLCKVNIEKVTMKMMDGKITYMINDKYYAEGCHKSKNKCIDSMRKWLDELSGE
jgi:hypothetical protein